MNWHKKSLYMGCALALFLAGSACSAQPQAPARPDGSVPVKDLSYAPDYKAVDEMAQSDVQVIHIAQVDDVNSFNRNLKKPKGIHLPPAEDGLRDPQNEATHILAAPKPAFEGMPPSEYGNRVDWVKTLDEKKVRPRWERDDPDAEPFVMDLDIVRPVKASVPDVVFPHRQHTEWLFCSNCHPAIFIPQKGANQINMSAILLGQKCGVCHGKVSFPITTKSCRKCHSKPKPDDWKPPLSEATLKNPWK